MEALANQGSWGKCLPTFEFVPAFVVKRVNKGIIQETLRGLLHRTLWTYFISTTKHN